MKQRKMDFFLLGNCTVLENQCRIIWPIQEMGYARYDNDTCEIL